MQKTVEVEHLGATEYKIKINIPSEVVDNKFDEFFKSIKKNVEVPGFRKGKVPVNRLKQMFSSKAKPTIAQMLIGEFYSKAIQESEISPVGNPKIDGFDPEDEYPGKFGFDNSYSVDLLVETLPTIDPVGYNNMKLDFPNHDLDKMLEAKMREYQEQFAERTQITDREAQEGDSLVIDFAGFIDGTQFEGGSAEGHTVNSLGSDQFIPGFEEQIVGMKVGEKKTIEVKFPEDYHAAHLASKDAKFDITLHSIVETKLAEVDEDLAMMVGYESVEDLKSHVQTEVESIKKSMDRRALDRQIVSKLIEANEFDAPQSMVNEEQARILAASNNKYENLPEVAKQELKKLAEFNVKRALIVDAIYEKEDDIEVTPEELNKLLEQHAASSNMSKDELVSNLYNSGQMDNFVGVLRVASVFDFIIDHSNNESEEENDSNDQ